MSRDAPKSSTPNADLFMAQSPAARRAINLHLCHAALDRWNQYAGTFRLRRMAYAESVTGTRRIVDIRLPADALRAAELNRPDAKIRSRYQEPMCAIQDNDWTPPQPVEFAYLAVRNAFGRYAQGDETIEEWAITSQALAASTDPAERTRRFREALSLFGAAESDPTDCHTGP
jgi:hypothetical protein